MTLPRSPEGTPFGRALRRWRSARHLSQLELASRADTPPRHVSFLETGRSRPSREMVLRLATALDLPLSEQNALLGSAGFDPAFAQRTLDDAALAPIRFVIERVLTAHAPYPGIVLNRWYDILDANLAGQRLFATAITTPTRPDGAGPPNLLDLVLGPMKQQVLNWNELVWDSVGRLRRDVAASPDDERLARLLERAEAAARALPARAAPPTPGESPVLYTRARIGTVTIATLSTLVHFGASRDVTVDGLHLELIYPADAASDAVLRALGAASPPLTDGRH